MDQPNYPTPDQLQADAQAMAADSLTRQLGALASGKTQAEALAAVYRQYAEGLQGILTGAQGQVAELLGREQLLNAEITRLRGLVDPAVLAANPAAADVLAAEDVAGSEAATHQTGVAKALEPPPHADAPEHVSEEDLSHEQPPEPPAAEPADPAEAAPT